MPKGSTTTVPNLPSLIRRTSKLRRDLAALIKRFPEDHLNPGDRIFIRLLDPVWRNQYGDIHGPYGQKETEAIAWIERYYEYLRDLEGYISGVLLRPDWFHALPMNGHRKPTAEECVRRLRLQQAALRTIRGLSGGKGTSPESGNGTDNLLVRLRYAVKQYSVQHCAAVTGLNRDTINDILSGKVKNPHHKTVEKLEKWLHDLEQARSPMNLQKTHTVKQLHS